MIDNYGCVSLILGTNATVAYIGVSDAVLPFWAIAAAVLINVFAAGVMYQKETSESYKLRIENMKLLNKKIEAEINQINMKTAEP